MSRKICFFNSFFTEHGQERANFAERFLPRDSDLFILTRSGENKYKLRKTKVIEISGNKLKLIFRLRKFCRKEKIDILLNLGNPQEAYALFFATLLTKTKYVVNIVGDIWNRPKVQKKLKDKIFLHIQNLFFPLSFIFSKKIVLPPGDIEFLTKKYFPFLKRKIMAIPLIMDESLFHSKNKRASRKKLGLPLKKEIILFVGRIDYLKGSDILLSLIKKNPKRFFILIGKILDKNFLKERFKNVSLVPFLDNRKKLVEYYNSADLLIHPSRTEGNPLVPREAMLCETPALVSRISSLRLIKQAFKANLDSEDMQKKIDEFFSLSKEQRKQIGEVNRQSIIDETSYKHLSKLHKEAIIG